MVNRIDQAEQLRGAVALPHLCEGPDSPQSSVRVLPTVLADAARVPFNIAGITRRALEGRRE